MRDKPFSRLNKTLLMTMAFFLLVAPIKIVAHGVGSSVATKQATSSCSISMPCPFPQGLCEVNLILPWLSWNIWLIWTWATMILIKAKSQNSLLLSPTYYTLTLVMLISEEIYLSSLGTFPICRPLILAGIILINLKT